MSDSGLSTIVARVAGLVLPMTITVVGGFFLGGWLDTKLGTSPLLLLGFRTKMAPLQFVPPELSLQQLKIALLQILLGRLRGAGWSGGG